MKKSIENSEGEPEKNDTAQPKDGFWNGDLDSETARHEAHLDFQREHERNIEKLGNEELVRLREKGEIGLEELTPEKTQQLIKKLGSQVFDHIKLQETRELRSAQIAEEVAKEKERERQEMIRRIEDKQPWNRVKKWFKDNWVSDHRKY